MAVGSWVVVNTAIEKIANRDINLVSDGFYAMLCNSALTPDGTFDQFADISANEVSGTGYGPITIAGTSVSRTGAITKFSCNDLNFGSVVTVTAKWCFVLKGNPNSRVSTDPILCYVDLNTDGASSTVSTLGGPFIVRVNSGGVFSLSMS